MLKHMACAMLVMACWVGSVSAGGRVETIKIQSENFGGNLVGISSVRNVQVYLPDGYDQSTKQYAVLYGFATFFEDHTALFSSYQLAALLDEAISQGRLLPVIVVTPDFSTPAGSSMFVNSSTTGNWEAFMIDELVPHIDKTYRTIADRSSRGVFGNHIGGYGALRFSARYPDVFGAVYALHPVATTSSGEGLVDFLDWEMYARAVETGDLSEHWSMGIFTAFFQAFLPNPKNPPFFADIPVRIENGEKVVDEKSLAKLTAALPAISDVEPYADNLKRLNGIKLDWGRFDPNDAHTRGNRAYSARLRKFGIPHVAEEYNGGWDEGVFDPGGRVDSDLFPFFQATLQLEPR